VARERGRPHERLPRDSAREQRGSSRAGAVSSLQRTVLPPLAPRLRLEPLASGRAPGIFILEHLPVPRTGRPPPVGLGREERNGRVTTHPPAPSGRGVRARYPQWWVILAAWAAWGLLWSGQVALYARLGGKAIPLGVALRLQMPLALAWALVTPGIIWLGRRFAPFGSPRWPFGVAVNLLASMVTVFALGFVLIVNQRVVFPSPDPPPLLLAGLRSFVWWFTTDGLLYWGILAIDYGVARYRETRERELRASQLEAQLSDARLQALKMQLEPHFLFNALHTIGQLVRTGQHALAVQVVAGLGDLLRQMLDGATTHEVPLKQELELVRGYLDIEQIRFRDRLKVVVDADPETLDARVPYLILQPLVENSIRHGIAPRTTVGRVVIGARRIAGALHLTVRDDGSGLPPGMKAGEGRGVGLANVSARLRQLYGEDASFEVVNAEDGGVVAQIVVPFRLAVADWQGAREA
jgi:two-component system, LytTR family, sensor kinase